MILSLSLGLMPKVGLGAQDPWQFLENFTPLPRSLTRIAERYVAMIYVNRDEQLMAAVIFDASCFAGSCELNHRAGYPWLTRKARIRAFMWIPRKRS